MASPDTDVSDLVDSLSLDEKCSLVRGAADPEGTATGYVPGVPRLDIPEFRLADGPLGIRIPGRSSTAFPASIAVAATFDPELARRQGVAMAREAKASGQHAVLGPGLNLVRVPNCGRNFEYYAEDPVVTADFAAAVVEGLQSEDVIATPKHYVANNQETKRLVVSAEVGERALRELYLPGFEAAVEAGAGSVMTAYNRVNGTHMSDHRRLVTEVLKDEWSFDGYVVSDWFGTESAVGAATAGLDLEMPGISLEALHEAFGIDPDAEMLEEGDDESIPAGETTTPRFATELKAAVGRDRAGLDRLDDMVARILGQMARIGLLDGDWDDGGALDAPEHRDLAETLAARGTVLLKNDDGALPLSDDADVALVGPGVAEAMLGGGGSSEVTPAREVSALAGIRARTDGSVVFEPGVERVVTPSFFDDESADAAGDDEDAGDDFPGGKTPDIDAAVDCAREADVAVVVVRDATTEGADRETLRLPGEQDELVEAVADAADRTVVVVQSGGPVELPWRDSVDAVVESWYPGQADGDALASVLYGDADPSGRLPVTFAPEESYPTASEERFPGVDDEAQYDEGVFVGYRHFDTADADDEPTYPFGHGLSYATFEYGEAEARGDDAVAVEVTNASDRAGREVVQAYVRPPAVAGVERPTRELAGYAAVELAAGETETVELSLSEHAFRRYDDAEGWTVDAGDYVVEVGRSSRDVRVETTVSR
ncbi:beta-glucosidase family protein [Haloferax sulfurifontis]|uniref:Beta-glucosidase n=1 Tax=Haloferax sulfurifontis ATCC BAA-897 TaxID=662480 RepID=M0IHG4_9EURY|nr:glycoside hydrolase family 3 C-terminal domain-containing protein [Haloferax sulfurifontis]ELZ96206.1 beta-glucosidase [Haloferax sulfurifontis ATCC BAA-897]